MKVICIDTRVGTTSINWPHITVGRTYEYENLNIIGLDMIRVVGDGGITANYPRVQFLDVIESRDKALTKILE